MSENIIGRRALLSAGAALALAPTIGRTATPATIPEGFNRFPIWPGRAPGGERVTMVEQEMLRTPQSQRDDTAFVHVTQPTLTMLRSQGPARGALLLIPGGGYRRVAIGHEGYQIARRFAAAGYHCYILVYRMPADGWAAGPDAPLQDAQRALRHVRARARADGFDPAKIGVLGFSAGGHLGARLISTKVTPTYSPVDAIDRESLDVAVAGLLYPVIMLEGDAVHAGSRNELLGPSPATSALKAFAGDVAITAGTPPTFLAHALDDRAVPPENSLALLRALQRAKVPSEMHLFERGGHGFGVALQDGSASPWPDLFLSFARRHGLS